LSSTGVGLLFNCVHQTSKSGQATYNVYDKVLCLQAHYIHVLNMLEIVLFSLKLHAVPLTEGGNRGSLSWPPSVRRPLNNAGLVKIRSSLSVAYQSKRVHFAYFRLKSACFLLCAFYTADAK